VRCGCALPAFAARAECQAKLTIQRQCFGRDANNGGQIHQRVIGLIQIGGAFFLRHGIAELTTTKAELVLELIDGNISAEAVILAQARNVDGTTFGRNGAGCFQLLFQRLTALCNARLRFTGSLKGFQIDVILANLLADNPHIRRRATAVNLELGFSAPCRFQGCRKLGILGSKGFNRLFAGVATTHIATHVSKSSFAIPFHRPNHLGRIELHAVIDAVFPLGKRNARQ